MNFRSTIFLSTVLIIFQSCVVYHTAPVSLSDAEGKGHGKVVFNNTEKTEFRNIVFKDSLYYLVEKRKDKRTNELGEVEKFEKSILIDSTNVSVIFLKDKKKSNFETAEVALFGTAIVTVFLLLKSLQNFGGW